MKTLVQFARLWKFPGNALLPVLFICLMATTTAFSQQAYKMGSAELKVLGTSNLHDWEMKATAFTCEGNFLLNSGAVQDIKSLDFSLPVTNLKSKESLMDKRAYKALKAEQNARIGFKLSAAEVKAQVATVSGNLTIAGVTKPVALTVNCSLNSDQSILVKGSKKIKMSDFQVPPPSFMLGALKTGDEVTIEFTLTLKNTGTQLTENIK